MEERKKALDETLQQLQNAEEPLMKQIEKTLEDRFNSMQTILMSFIDEKINKSLNQRFTNAMSFAFATSGANASFTQADIKQQQSTNPQSFRELMLATRNEELAEEKEKKERMKNMIIHGKDEGKGKEEALEFLNDMLEIIGCKAAVKSIICIGQCAPNKTRPIRVVFEKEEEKRQIMNNLSKLKDCMDYRGISVTDDYTVSERAMIRKFVEDARQKNSLETDECNYIWKARGTPQSGLTIKRFRKIKATISTEINENNH